MPISNVRFTGYNPSLTTVQKSVKFPKPVAFTGIRYHKVITNNVSLKGIWTGIKELFSNMGKFLNFLKPHVDKANTALDKSWGAIWTKIKPVI